MTSIPAARFDNVGLGDDGVERADRGLSSGSAARATVEQIPRGAAVHVALAQACRCQDSMAAVACLRQVEEPQGVLVGWSSRRASQGSRP